MEELGSRMSDTLILKSDVSEMKSKGVGMFNEHDTDNGTRRVKELVVSFESLSTGFNLD